MDEQLLHRFFRNCCNEQEIEEVYQWFSTPEGQDYLEEKTRNDVERYTEEENLLLTPDIPSGAILSRIRQTKSRSRMIPKNQWVVKIAVAAIVLLILSGGFVMMQHHSSFAEDEEEIAWRHIETGADQQRLVTLSDGTRIRLNSNSKITLPEQFPPDQRTVTLQGEAWFEVAKESERPFTVMADVLNISVLGTEFNVKIDSLSQNIQVAVAEGRVSLNNQMDNEMDSIGAILSQNTYAIYNTQSEEILIESSPVVNYLSWMSGRLQFYDDPLWTVSRYLERIYNVDFQMDSSLRNLTLSIDLRKESLDSVLDIIASTLNLDYQIHQDTVHWTSNKQQPITNPTE